MVSSLIYIVNDTRDVKNDRCHPTKCRRSIVSGIVSVKNACALACILGGISFLINISLWKGGALFLLLYLILNLLYSYGRKYCSGQYFDG